ncbi:hypothetical protein M9Y10_004941 [Tritrichomonas musculus]|uniref:DUF3447 domain-containing protein n=1 Tax=Tritrichomonas musculus TaxID=1915356 RepID=A0ABR2JJW8_9EUKA
MNLDLEKDSLFKISSLQEMILEINSTNIQEAKQYLNENEFFNDKQSIKQLLFTIDAVSHARPNTIPYLCELLVYSSEHIKKFYKSSDVAPIFHNNQIYLTLYQCNIIDIDSLVSISRCGFATFLFFAKELEEKAPSFYYGRLQKSSIIRRCIKSEEKSGNHQQNICEKEEDPLTVSIQKDDIIQFQDILSHSNISINSQTRYSINQANEFANEGYDLPSLIEYAAFNGSVKIFKFLWMKEAEMSENILKMAIFGGSYEIIHLIESKNIVFDKSALNTAIEYHRNEIVDYIHNSFEIELNNSSLLTSISYYNIPIFLNHFENTDNLLNLDFEKAIEIACEKGTFDVVTFLTNFEKNKNLLGLSKASAKGHLDIVEYLINVTKCNVNVKDPNGWTPLFFAVRNFHFDVLNFLLSVPEIDINVIDETGVLFC